MPKLDLLLPSMVEPKNEFSVNILNKISGDNFTIYYMPSCPTLESYFVYIENLILLHIKTSVSYIWKFIFIRGNINDLAGYFTAWNKISRLIQNL